MEKHKHTVLLYGTLRKGCENHALLETPEYIETIVLRGFKMITQGPWPYILRGAENDQITAEKYIVDAETLALLDWIEGFTELNSPDNLYERIEINTDPVEKAWIYVISDAVYDRIKGDCTEIPGGDWVKWIRHSSGYPDKR